MITAFDGLNKNDLRVSEGGYDVILFPLVPVSMYRDKRNFFV